MLNTILVILASLLALLIVLISPIAKAFGFDMRLKTLDGIELNSLPSGIGVSNTINTIGDIINDISSNSLSKILMTVLIISIVIIINTYIWSASP